MRLCRRTAPSPIADRGQRRASFQRARSHETKRMLVQAAMALWRTKGYATTTVADICTAAGCLEALFYFYFPRKEDVLFEVGVLSTQSAQQTSTQLLAEALRDRRGHRRGAAQPSNSRWPATRVNSSSRPSSRVTATNTGSSPATHRPTSTPTCSPSCSPAHQDGKLAARRRRHLAYLAGTLSARAPDTGPQALRRPPFPTSSPRHRRLDRRLQPTSRVRGVHEGVV